MQYEVKVNRLAVREGPSKKNSIITFINKFDVVDELERRGNWIRHAKGWSLVKENDDNLFLSIIPIINKNTVLKRTKSSSNTPKKKEENKKQEAKPIKKDDKDKDKKEEPKEEHDEPREEREGDTDYSKYSSSIDYTSSNATHFISSVRGIHGMPYQFMANTDPRPDGSRFGRKFTSKIVSRIPLLLLTPGVPEFMDGYSKKQKNDLLAGTLDEDIEGVEGVFDSKNGKLYSFKMAYDDYYKYVNPMLNNVAINLGIGDVEFHGTSLRRFHWENYTNDALTSFVSSKEIVAFYIDSETQIQETFSNTTGESQLSGAVNGMAAMAREIQFLIGGVAGSKYEEMKDNVENATGILNEFTSKYSNIFPMSVVNKLTNGLEVLVGGGQMAFPEIWQDSDFSRSYDVNIKLRSPDADKFSIYINIFVPLIHLIALAAPHQLGTMGFQSPFLVRAFYKGFFNMDMGIITSLNIAKGDKGRWTLDGLPTEVEVSMSMKDLYQILYISTGENPLEVLNNTMLLDYLANMCGINVNTPDMKKAATIWYNTITNWAYDKVTFNGFMGVENALSNLMSKLF